MDLLASYSDDNSKQSPSSIPLPNDKYDTKLEKGTSLEEEWASFAKLIDGENLSEPIISSTNEKVAAAKRTFSESGTSQSYAYEIQSSSSSCSSRSNSVEPEKRSSPDKTETVPVEEESALPANYRPRKDSGKGSSTSRSRSPSRSPSHSPKRQKRSSKDKRSRSRSKGRRKKSRSASRDKKSRSRSRDRHRKSKKERRRHRSSSRGRKSRSRSRKRSTSRHRSPHSRRSRSRSRDRKHPRDRRSSRERNRRRSKDRSHRRGKHSKTRHRSRSRSRSPRRHHSRSRSRSYSPRSAKMSSVDSYQKKISGTFMKKAKPLTFREKMRQDLLKASKMLTEQGESEKETVGMPLPVSTESASVTPQMALLQTMAVMHQKAQEMTGVTVPKYYNPAAVNPLKYAEQYQKRKLLWSKNKEKKEEGAEHWQATAFQADKDGKTTAKFRKLMGMKEEAPVSDDALTEEQRAKREELFNRLDKDYEFARMSTHTHRGVGLGFASQGMSMPQFPQP